MTGLASAPPPAPRGDEELSDVAAIEGVLRRLCRHHALVSARREGSARNHLSVILKVDSAQKLLSFDVLQPDPYPPLKVGEELRLRSRLDGADVIFSCEVMSYEEFDGAPALRLSLPTRLRIRERRNAHRVPLARIPRAGGTVTGQAGTQALNVIDISLGGLGATLDRGTPVAIGDHLQVEVEFAGEQILGTVEVRSCAAHGERLRVGLRFTEFPPRELDRLANAILRLERQIIREARRA